MSFGAGSLDVDADAGNRGCTEPVDVLTVLKLAAEPIDSPELYDFLVISGVVRAEDGVAEALRGIMDGDLESARVSVAIGGGGGTLVTWLRLWEPGNMDIRCMRFVSVGLIVLAPSPLTCGGVPWAWAPGIIDARFTTPDDEGVRPRPFTRGERGGSVECRFCSGVSVASVENAV